MNGDLPRMHLRARLLPEGRETDIWVADGVISREPLADARTTVSGGWLMPALVDAHLHVGVADIGGPLDSAVLDDELDELARTGIGAARVLGSPSPLPQAVLDGGRGPLLQTAGVPVAAPDRFIPGWGRRASDDELADICVLESRFGWSKIIADWFDESGGYDAIFSQRALHDAVAAVHAHGRRVAVHTQSSEGARGAVAAGADTIEHGMHLPPEVLPQLAAQGGVLVPTGVVFEHLAPSMSADGVPSTLQRWFAEGLAAHPGLVRDTWEAGVTILAGTDMPVGALIDEIHWLINAGLPVDDAIGAASWTTREALGLPRLRDGDRADLIWTQEDPREDVDVLRKPDRVILGGRMIV